LGHAAAAAVYRQYRAELDGLEANGRRHEGS
jgi:hypothetical protein